jgi:transcriptional regulator of arginine metabolism
LNIFAALLYKYTKPMKAKMQRLVAIREIISEREVSSQEELVMLLKRKGFDLTQATLSRDLKMMQVIRVPGYEGGYVYRLPQQAQIPAGDDEAQAVRYLFEGIVSVDVSGNMAVLKTKPAYASSIAAIIDASNPFEVLGTIAGDDTIFMVIREGVERADMIGLILKIFPNLKGRLI